MLRSFVVAAAIGAVGMGLAPTGGAEPQPYGPTTLHGPLYGPHVPASPVSQQNAVSSAQDYIELSAFSRQGLIEQLQYEGYSTADAVYAVDFISVDWNAQAARSAKEYLKMTSFSRSGLQEQLEYEGFTPSQAAYGVSVAYR